MSDDSDGFNDQVKEAKIEEEGSASNVNESDSSFENRIEKIVNFSDLDESIKGEDVVNIGQIKALGLENKDKLRDLDYNDKVGGEQKEKAKFFKD